MLDKYFIEKEIKKNKVQLIRIEFKSILKKYQYEEYQNLPQVLDKLKKQKFSNIVEIYDVKIDEKEGLISVWEEACEQDLRQMMKNNKEKFDISENLKCLLDVIEGLLQLKRLKIFHRDIKPDNIVHDGKNYKIIDFDRAKVFGNGDIRVHSLNIGTIGYQAPEIISNQPYSFQCDVWSLGCVFYFLLFKHEIQKDQIYFPKEPKYDDKIIELLRKMLEKNQTQRITLEKLKEEALKLQNMCNNSNLSTTVGQNTTPISLDQNQLDEKFNTIMEKLIKNEQNLENMIYLYQFWVQRLEKRSPSDQELRKIISYELLQKINEGEKKKIKINIFNSLDYIKQKLKCFKELQEFYDF